MNSILPKREKTIEIHQEIYSDYKLYRNNSIDHKVSVQNVINDWKKAGKKISESRVYTALRTIKNTSNLDKKL